MALQYQVITALEAQAAALAQRSLHCSTMGPYGYAYLPETDTVVSRVMTPPKAFTSVPGNVNVTLHGKRELSLLIELRLLIS